MFFAFSRRTLFHHPPSVRQRQTKRRKRPTQDLYFRLWLCSRNSEPEQRSSRSLFTGEYVVFVPWTANSEFALFGNLCSGPKIPKQRSSVREFLSPEQKLWTEKSSAIKLHCILSDLDISWWWIGPNKKSSDDLTTDRFLLHVFRKTLDLR